MLALQKPLKRILVAAAMHAARHPRAYVGCIVALALTLVSAGYFTNFRIENRESELFRPTGSRVDQHATWIRDVFKKKQTTAITGNGDRMDIPDVVGGGDDNVFLLVLVHAQGENVVTKEGIERTFEAINRARSVSGYHEYCAAHGDAPCPFDGILKFACLAYDIPIDDNATKVCGIAGVTGFWFHNTTVFEKYVETDQDVRETLSIDIFPGEEGEFDVINFIGHPEYETSDGTQVLVKAKSYATGMTLPNPSSDMAHSLEKDMLDELLELQDEWDADSNNLYRVEVMASVSFSEEFTRGIVGDLILTPFAGLLMVCFATLVFFRPDWLHSRTMLGMGAVGCVMLSLLSGYGLLFLIGVPFTNLTLVRTLLV